MISIVSWLLIIFIGIPVCIMFIIPSLAFLGERIKWIPSFNFLLKYFDVDISQPPYCDWMERSPILFISMTSIELYISFFLVKVLKLFKWIVTRIFKILKGLVKWQWKKYEEFDKELEAEEKKRERQRDTQRRKGQFKKVWVKGHYEVVDGKKVWITAHYEKIPIVRR